jgi:hypothetical protein
MKKKLDLDAHIGILLTCCSLIAWLVLWYAKVPSYKVCTMFAAFIATLMQTIFYISDHIMNLGVWTRCTIHCLVTGLFVTLYAFTTSDTPWFDSIGVNLIFLIFFLIRYSYENNAYYGE